MAALPRFSLEPLTFAGMPALDLVRTAGATGYDYVSLVLNAPLPFVAADRIVADAEARGEVAIAMRETGVDLLDIECFNLTGDAVVEDFRPALECGHALGARSGLAILWNNPDRADALRKFQRLCDMAADYGIRINLEFLAVCRDMPSLPHALDFVRDSGRENAGLVIDLVHLARTGSSIADLRALDPRWIGLAQLCDGPAVMPADRLLEEAGEERLFPGEGELPVEAFVQAFPHDIMGLEVPRKRMLADTPPIEIAQAMIDAARQVYRRAGVH